MSLPLATDKLLPLKDLIGTPDTTVADLIRRSAEVEALTRLVRDLVPAQLKPHVVAACRRNTTLTIVTDSPAWAAQLRFRAEDIRTSLNARQGHSLQKLRVSVSAPG